MEILNKNQRTSARWRVAALVGIMIIVNGLTLYATHEKYSLNGSDQIDELKRELETLKNQYRGDEANWKSEKKRLENQAAQNAGNGDDAAVMAVMEGQLEDCKEDRERLRNQLDAKDRKIEELRNEIE